jgi:ABC-2 type transport system ATP-binding protein
MIQVKSLTKYYGEKIGVQDIDFTVQQGEIMGLLGPNGSGKTTIMKMMTGYMPPSSGTVIVDGYDVLAAPKEVTGRIGFLPEAPPLYPEMRVGEYLHFIAAIKGVERGRRKARVEETMEMVNAANVRDRLIRNLSKGYKQRVGLAQAMVSNPPILILDEPTVGLDPRQINEVRQLIEKLGRERTVILSSHILAEVGMVCKRLVILNKGRIVAMDTTENLASGIADAGRFLLTVKAGLEETERVLASVPGIREFRPLENVPRANKGYCSFVIENDKGSEVRENLSRALLGRGIPIIEMRSAGAALEETFLQLTGGGSVEGSGS